MTGSLSCRPRTDRRGFSLLELLLVLVLVGIMAGVGGPATGRFLDSLEFRRQTNRVLAAVRYARLQAITGGRSLVLALDGQTFTLTGATTESRDPGLGEEASLLLEPEELVFSAEGYATPGRITLSSGSRQAVIVIEPLTGLPELEER